MLSSSILFCSSLIFSILLYSTLFYPIYLSTYLPIYLSTCLSASLPIYLSTDMNICILILIWCILVSIVFIYSGRSMQVVVVPHLLHRRSPPTKLLETCGLRKAWHEHIIWLTKLHLAILFSRFSWTATFRIWSLIIQLSLELCRLPRHRTQKRSQFRTPETLNKRHYIP